jgi:hypothetical protein
VCVCLKVGPVYVCFSLTSVFVGKENKACVFVKRC